MDEIKTRVDGAEKTLACGEEHPPHTTYTGCEEDIFFTPQSPIEDPFGLF